jgi:hypothetical protein
MWAFGHTHWECDFERVRVRVLSNQRGYGEGRDDYDPRKTVVLPYSMPAMSDFARLYVQL